MSATTRIYRNTTKQTVDLLGVGEVEPGEQISVTAEYHQPINLANYPGVVEVTDEEVAPEAPSAPAEETPEAPSE